MYPVPLGPYVLLRALGDGASATVHLAAHATTGQTVAIKVLHPRVADIVEVRARLELEARLLCRIRARHVVAGIDAGRREDGSPYVVLELLDGPTVSERLEHGPLSVAAAIAIAEATLDGLEALHGAGIVHRDVKASNVVLHRDAWGVVPKLIDLGVCADTRTDADPRTTRAGAIVGTPCYMAPEQLESAAVDARTDLFGVGGMLYECLTGRAPRDGRSFAEILVEARDSGFPPLAQLRPDCPRALAELVASALAREPRDRPISAREMREKLAAIRDSLELPVGAYTLDDLVEPAATPIPLSARSARLDAERSAHAPRRRRRAAYVAAVAVACALVAAGMTASDGRTRTSSPQGSVAPTRVTRVMHATASPLVAEPVVHANLGARPPLAAPTSVAIPSVTGAPRRLGITPRSPAVREHATRPVAAQPSPDVIAVGDAPRADDYLFAPPDPFAR